MRDFKDESGVTWTATVAERAGDDYKGRLHLVFRRVGEEGGPPAELQDVRWNSRKTALRTIETMSDVELRRRLRWARGRSNERSGTSMPG